MSQYSSFLKIESAHYERTHRKIGHQLAPRPCPRAPTKRRGVPGGGNTLRAHGTKWLLRANLINTQDRFG